MYGVFEILGEKMQPVPEQQCTLHGVDRFEHKLAKEKGLQQTALAWALNGGSNWIKGK